ncbi:hypothetical protein ABZP36_026477 [Zizania latifolia]
MAAAASALRLRDRGKETAAAAGRVDQEGGVPGARDHGRPHGHKPHQGRVIVILLSSTSPPLPSSRGMCMFGCFTVAMAAAAAADTVASLSPLTSISSDVKVWNRTRSKCDPLLSPGAKMPAHMYESSPANVASSCDVEVACKANGAAEGMAPGRGYVDVSTVDAATSKLIGQHITSTGASFLEVPVSGSKKPAEDGLLIFLTAGKLLPPRLSRFFLGDVGNGAAMKLVVNMVMGSMMVLFSGLLLSEKVGLDPNILVEDALALSIISQGATSPPMFSLKGPSMVKAAYPTAFPLKHQQKDLRLVLALAESLSQSIPTVAAANELYKVGKSLGLADHDLSAVIEALKAKEQNSQP